MRSVVRAVLLAALSLAFGAEVDGIAFGKPKDAATTCGSTSSRRVVGTIKKVLHSKVYVGRRYVGVTPFDVFSGSHICTDRTGEAIFDLARSKKSVACIALQRADVQVTPTVSRAASFQRGASWCSIRRHGRRFAVPSGGLQFLTTTRALVGVLVERRTIKVVEGSISLSTPLHDGVKVGPNKQVVVSGKGEISKMSLSLSSEEQLAIAQLRLA